MHSPCSFCSARFTPSSSARLARRCALASCRWAEQVTKREGRYLCPAPPETRRSGEGKRGCCTRPIARRHLQQAAARWPVKQLRLALRAAVASASRSITTRRSCKQTHNPGVSQRRAAASTPQSPDVKVARAAYAKQPHQQCNPSQPTAYAAPRADEPPASPCICGGRAGGPAGSPPCGPAAQGSKAKPARRFTSPPQVRALRQQLHKKILQCRRGARSPRLSLAKHRGNGRPPMQPSSPPSSTPRLRRPLTPEGTSKPPSPHLLEGHLLVLVSLPILIIACFLLLLPLFLVRAAGRRCAKRLAGGGGACQQRLLLVLGIGDDLRSVGQKGERQGPERSLWFLPCHRSLCFRQLRPVYAGGPASYPAAA